MRKITTLIALSLFACVGDQEESVEQPTSESAPLEIIKPGLLPKILPSFAPLPYPKIRPGIFALPITCTSEWGIHPGMEMECRLTNSAPASVAWSFTASGVPTFASTEARPRYVLRGNVSVEAHVTPTHGAPVPYRINITPTPFDRQVERWPGGATARTLQGFSLVKRGDGLVFAHARQRPTSAALGRLYLIELGMQDATGAWTFSDVTTPSTDLQVSSPRIAVGSDGRLRMLYLGQGKAAGMMVLHFARALVDRPASPSDWEVTRLNETLEVDHHLALTSDDRPIISFYHPDNHAQQMRLLIGAKATPESKADFSEVLVDDRSFNGDVFMGVHHALYLENDVPVVFYDSGIPAFSYPDGTRVRRMTFARATSTAPTDAASFARHEVDAITLDHPQFKRIGDRYCVAGAAPATVRLLCSNDLTPATFEDWSAVTVAPTVTAPDGIQLDALDERPILLANGKVFIAVNRAPIGEADFVQTALHPDAFPGSSGFLVVPSGTARGIHALTMDATTLGVMLDRLH